MVGTSHGRRRFATLFGVGLTLAATVQVSTAHLQTASAATDEDVNYRVDAAQTGAQTNDNLTPPLEKRWLKSFVGGQVSYPLIAGGRVFVTVANGPIGDQSGTKLYALDATSGTELWHAAVGGNNSEFAAAAYEGGRVYVVNADGRVRAYDGASGLLAWVRDTNLRVFAPPTASGGSVYIYGYDAYYSMARVIAIGEAHGDIRWSAVGSLLSGDFGDVVVSPTGVFVSSACEQTYAFDPASGAQLWHYATGCFGGGGLPAALYDGKLYVRDSFRGYPPAILDPATGAKLGTFSSLSAPAFSGGTGFFDAPPTSAGPHEVQATDLTSGLPNWVFSGDGHLVTDPLVVGGLVFTGSAQGNLYALDNRTGAMVWSTNVGNPINGFNPGE